MRGILAALRQKFHLSDCPNLADHLLPTPINVDPYRMGQLGAGMSLFWRVARRRATDAAAPPIPRAIPTLQNAGRVSVLQGWYYLLDADSRMPPDPRFDVLTEHLTCIEQTEEDIVLHKTRLEHITIARLRRQCVADIKRLQRRRAYELKRLAAALRQYDDLARRLDLVQSVPGIGERTAIALVVRMPELGQVSREEAASLVGLAPFVHQTGKRQGETHIGGGRSRLRRSLYAAALPAAFHWNPALKAFHQRLIGRKTLRANDDETQAPSAIPSLRIGNFRNEHSCL